MVLWKKSQATVNGKEKKRHPWQIPLWIAVALTILWIALVITVYGPRAVTLPPNEVGDFLAGVFAPPAFFWLILGYFLQAHELRAQIREMQQESATNREMLALSRERDLREWNQNQPHFEFENTWQTGNRARANFINKGQRASHVSFHAIDPPGKVGVLVGMDNILTVREMQSIDSNGKISVDIQPDGSGVFSIRYRDILGGWGEAIVLREGAMLFRVVDHRPAARE